MPTARAVPSPNGTNYEKLYYFTVPRGSSVQQAMDAAMRRGGRDQGEVEGERRGRFENALNISGLSADWSAAVMDVYDSIHGGGSTRDKKFGDDEESTEQWLDREDRPEEHGGSGSGEVDDEAEALAQGRGARRFEPGTIDRRRADDRKRRRAHDERMANDAAYSADQMFGLSRIKSATSWR
jgi:hypothetical protein